ncbi:MAG: hypothetical protein J3T61_12425, partial [Candidatus Brocadiales bacterium]|nr:hypothetical protein [Candidatus Bathyanammoxibius sp.]
RSYRDEGSRPATTLAPKAGDDFFADCVLCSGDVERILVSPILSGYSACDCSRAARFTSLRRPTVNC